jgi:uncharacterized protein
VSRIFLDTMLLIYWLEGHRQYNSRVQEILLRTVERDDQLCTSSLAMGEILVGLHKRGAIDSLREVQDFFQHGPIEVIPYTLEVADLYAEIRARLGVSSADGIHLACAASVGTDLFLTNDNRLVGKVIPGIQFIAGLDTNIL